MEEQESKIVSMKDLVGKLQEIPKTKIKSERSYIVSEFVAELNKERKVNPQLIAIKLSHIKALQDLYAFLSICRDYKNRKGSFSKCFYGALKVKNSYAPRSLTSISNEI